MLISNFIFVYFTEGQAILKFVPKRHNGNKCFEVVVCVWIKVGRRNKKWKIWSQTHIKKKKPLDQETSLYTESILLKCQSCFWRAREGLNSGQRKS